MAIYKCKMCGGDLEIVDGSSVAVCQYCGSKQTVPTADNEKKMTLFGRANRLRSACEFDKAAGVYESIVADFPEEAEAYWGLVLCRYGIEYVDDPSTGKKVPTCHRSSFDSVMEDSDFEQVMENADEVARRVYRDEAKAIEELRRGIVEISGKEPPYDIFICYKETDEKGERTLDSVLAQDVYDALTEKGYRVFFSRISLEDKLGTEYEPYIFAALNSAKVMLAFGTDYAYYNAVWVKNEWSRYLKLVAQDKSRHLIPCYKNLDAYDMPKEFAKLQAQDMGKVGAMQDLLRGVDKILGKSAAKPIADSISTVNGSVSTDSLVKRALLFLEDSRWDDANTYCEKVLDLNPECAEAYAIKLMLELHVNRMQELGEQPDPIDEYDSYQKALRFADTSFAKKLTDFQANICYRRGNDILGKASEEQEYNKASEWFEKAGNYKDAHDRSKQCLDRAAEILHEKTFQEACKNCDLAESMALAPRILTLKKAADLFASISSYKDSADRESDLRNGLVKLETQLEAKKRKQRKTTIIIVSSIATVAVLVLVTIFGIIPEVQYHKAEDEYTAENYDTAIQMFTKLDGFKDSHHRIVEVTYEKGCHALIKGDYATAYDTLMLDESLNDSEVKIRKAYADWTDKLKESGQKYAEQISSNGNYVDAIDVLTQADACDDSEELLQLCYVGAAEECYQSQKYVDAYGYYIKINEYDKTTELYKKCKYETGLQKITDKEYKDAVALFYELGNYEDSATQVNIAKYKYVMANKNRTNTTTYTYLKDLKSIGYKDSADIFKTLYAWKITQVCANTCETDTSTLNSSVSRTCGYYHASFKLSGGEPGVSISMYHTISWPNGETKRSSWNWNSIYDGYEFGYQYDTGLYNDPSSGKTGNLVTRIYNCATGELLGEFSIKITI